MKNQERATGQKLIFGLSPKATIINAFVIVFLYNLLWAIKLCEQIPSGIDYTNPPEDLILTEVPWYYTLPFAAIAVFMVSAWVDYKISITKNEKEKPGISNNFYWKKFVYVVGGFMITSLIAKIISVFIVLLIK